MRNFSCIGHRGAKGLEPENTLRSIRAALDLGVDGIEIDVYWVDGELVVIHDDTLERTTNGSGRVEEQSFAHLRSLDAGKGEKIPTLREVFETVNRRAFINIELKGAFTAEPVWSLMEKFVQHEKWTWEDFLVSSFDLAELRKLQGCEVRIGPLFSDPPPDCIAIAKAMDAYSLHTAARHVSETFAGRVHDAGLKLLVYTVNSPHEMEKMRAMGVDGIFTDYPDRAMKLKGSA